LELCELEEEIDNKLLIIENFDQEKEKMNVIIYFYWPYFESKRYSQINI